MRGIVKYFAIVMLLLVCGEASAQKMKERKCVRDGNEYYNENNFAKSIERYQKALEHDPNSFEAKFDLGSALYRSERYEEAEKTLLPLLENKSLSEAARGEVAYNLGNTQFAQQKYKEALSSYRQAMRCNPNDEDAKFNYAFTKRLIQQQEQQQQQQNQDQNQDQNKDNKDNQQDNQNQQNEQNQQQPQNEEGKDEQQEGGQRPEGAMTPEQQEALLQAIQAEEDKTQDKLKEKKGVLIRGSKNW